MTLVNAAITFATLSALCLILARLIERNEQRNINLRASGREENDGENFI